MWGSFIKSAAAIASEQASSLVGRVDEFASQGLSTASQLLEKLDGIGNAAEEAGTGEDPSEPESSEIEVSHASAMETQPVSAEESARPIANTSLEASRFPTKEPQQQRRRKDVAKAAEPTEVTSLVGESSASMHSAPSNLSISALEGAESPAPAKTVDVRRYQNRIKKLEKEKAELEEEVSSLQVAVASLSKELQDALSTNQKDRLHEEWEREKEELNNQLAAQEAKLALDRQQREQITSQQQLALTLLQEEKKAMQAKLAKLEGLVEENKTLRSELKAVRDFCSELETSRNQLQAKLVDMSEQLQNQQASDRSGLSALEDEKRVLNERLQHLSSENEGYCSQISHLQQSLADLRAEQAEALERLRSQATAAAQQQAEEHAQERSRLEAQQALLSERENEFIAAKKMLEDKYAALQTEIELVRTERSELQTQVASLQASLETAEAAVAAAAVAATVPDSKPGDANKSDRRKKKGASLAHSIYSTHVESGAPSSRDNSREEREESGLGVSVVPESSPLSSQSSEVQHFQTQLEDMNRERQKFQALYNTSLQKYDAMLQERETLHMQNQDWCNKHAAARKEIATLSSLNADLERVCAELRQRLDSLAEKEASSEGGEGPAGPVVDLKKKQMEAQLAELEQALEQDDRRPSQDLGSPSLRLEALTSQLQELEQEHGSLQSRYDQLQAQLVSAQEQLLLAKAEVEAVRTEHEVDRTSLLHSLEEREALCSSLSAQIDKLSADILAMEAAANIKAVAAQQAQDELHERIAASAREVQQWQTQATELQQAMQAAKLEKQAWEQERQQAEDAHRERLTALEQQWEAGRKDELRVLREAHEVSLGALQSELDSLRAAHEALSERWAAAQQASDGHVALEQEILALQAENERWETQYNANLAQYKTLLDQYNALKVTASTAEDGHQAAQQVIAKLEAQHRSDREALSALQEQHDQLQDELLQYQQDLAQEQTRSQEVAQTLAQARQELHELRERDGQASDLKTELGKLRDQLHRSITTKNELDAERKLLADDKSRLQSTLTTLEGVHAQVVQEGRERQRLLEQAEKRVQALELAQADWQQRHAQLVDAHDRLTEQNVRLQQEHTALCTQWEDLRNQHTEASTRAQQLENSQREHVDLTSRHHALQEQVAALQETQAKQQAALSAFEGKKKKDLENLRKQNELISSLKNKVASLEAMEADFQALQVRYQALDEQHRAAMGEIAQLREEVQRQSTQSATQCASKDTETLAAIQRVHQLEVLLQSQAKEWEQAKEAMAAEQQQWQQQREQLLLQLQQERALAASSGTTSIVEGGAKDVPTESSAPPSVDSAEVLELRQLVRQQKVQLGDLLAERKDLLSQVDTTQQQLAHYFQHSVYNASASSGGQIAHINGGHGHAGYDEERGMLLDSQKKDLAGAPPSLIQMWTLFRQHCPGTVMAALPERPPRLTIAAQVSIAYGVLLQIVVVYQYLRCH